MDGASCVRIESSHAAPRAGICQKRSLT